MAIVSPCERREPLVAVHWLRLNGLGYKSRFFTHDWQFLVWETAKSSAKRKLSLWTCMNWFTGWYSDVIIEDQSCRLNSIYRWPFGHRLWTLGSWKYHWKGLAENCRSTCALGNLRFWENRFSKNTERISHGLQIVIRVTPNRSKFSQIHPGFGRKMNVLT